MTTPSAEEPKVYLDYTQAELDRAYDQRAWVDNADEILRAYSDQSASIRAQMRHRRDVPYGAGDDE